MKKKLPFLMISLILFICSILSSCQYDSPKSIVGAQLNDRGELILTYSDDTTQNLGVVKGENGKDGKDGVDLTPCAHTYGDWTTVLAPSCTSIGYATRSCSLCGDLDYLITNPLGHTYENPVDVVHTCQQHWINKTCTTCGDTALVEEPATKDHFYGDWKTVEEYACGAIKQEKSCIYCNEKQIQTLNFSAHTFNENTLCTTCGHQEFIQSEEYFEETTREDFYFGTVTCKVWWNKDRTFALKCAPWQETFFIYGYMGNPVNVVLPIYDNLPNCYIQDNAFQNCTTLKSIYIPDTVTRIEDYAFDGCTNLETAHLSENLQLIGAYSFGNCSSLTTMSFQDNTFTSLHFVTDAFTNCTSLTEVYFPLNKKSAVGSGCFKNCPSLTTLYISKNEYSYFMDGFKDYPFKLNFVFYT